ncbi:MAG: hypothetical protein J6N78_01995 [Clostridia bacterium]|nr:hypothetical protein [Clostridia bacterium]
MIYLVTKQTELFKSDLYEVIDVQSSLKLLNPFKIIQIDSETDGVYPFGNINKLLCFQIGVPDMQFVIDCKSINIVEYKELLESKFCIGHNLKFDLAFLYNHNIIPRRVYDTMIVEQLLHLGFSYNPIDINTYTRNNYSFPYHEKGYECVLSFALDAVVKKYLDVDVDKSIRGDIIWKGLADDVIQYAANDVKWLEEVQKFQVKKLKELNMMKAAELECLAVPAITYIEWCGMKLDVNKWKQKMDKDQANLANSKKALDNFIIEFWKARRGDGNYLYKSLVKDDLGRDFLVDDKVPFFYKKGKATIPYVSINNEGDLFLGYNLEPQCNINWDSSKQVIDIAKLLGFNTAIEDKDTGEQKDSVLEKQLAVQVGINDEFLKLYFDYKEASKLVTTYGQGHLDAICPVDSRIHTTYKQLGASSGRMSCGSSKNVYDLAKYKGIKEVKMPNLQQLPHDAFTRECFAAEDGYTMCACDFSAEEARLQADIYDEPQLKQIFEQDLDSHSVYAKIFFPEELADIDVKDVKKLRKDLRDKAKSPEFLLSYGGGVQGLMKALNCEYDKAKQIKDNYDKAFKATKAFEARMWNDLYVKGYITINPITGHKLFWQDIQQWRARQATNTQLPSDSATAAKYKRLCRNAPSQGTGAIIMKESLTNLFNKIVETNNFNKVKIENTIHDEIVISYPNHYKWDIVIKEVMEEAARKYCKTVEIPAVPECGKYWIH